MTDAVSPLRRVKQSFRRWRLARLGVVASRSVPKTTIGRGSGAWTVNLDGIGQGSVVYSFGAGTDISFDLDLHRLTGAEVHIFDPTPRSIQWMREQQLPDRVFFHEFGIGDHDGDVTFHAPRRATSSHFSPVRRYRDDRDPTTVTAPVYRLESIARRLGHARIDLVKMDIEGGEYDVIADWVSHPVPLRQFLVEFHHAYATIPIGRTVDSVQRLRELGFECFHISARTYEMSFIAV